MAILSVPNTGLEIQDPTHIQKYLNDLGVYFEQWHCEVLFDDEASQDEILAAYAKDLDPFMKQGGYHTADVISIHATTPNYEVFNVLCERGDLISVPAGTKHWFDAGQSNPFVKAIRIFTDMSGWTPHYTEAGTELNFSDFKIPSRG